MQYIHPVSRSEPTTNISDVVYKDYVHKISNWQAKTDPMRTHTYIHRFKTLKQMRWHVTEAHIYSTVHTHTLIQFLYYKGQVARKTRLVGKRETLAKAHL